MTALAERYRRVSSVGSVRTLWAALGLLVVFGAWRAPSVPVFTAFALVCIATAIPIFIWVLAGAKGVPAFPMLALAHIPYFALPALDGIERFGQYDDSDLVAAAATVASYLVCGTIAWATLSRRAWRASDPIDRADHRNVERLIFIGLAMGIGFHVAVSMGNVGGLGTLYGAVRSLVVTFCVVACFLLGVARAKRALDGSTSAIAMAGVALVVMLSWSSLFLVAGLLYIVALLVGYVIASRRVPWVTVAIVVAVATVLHSGKGEMRAKYWMADTNYSGGISLPKLPGFMAEWLYEGVVALASDDARTSLLQRASLLQMTLMAESLTPQVIDYLRGETYAMLPSIVVPRFLDATKPPSQIGMDLLNVRYGVLTADEAAVTAVGWGLMAESYANFGLAGVLVMGTLLGLYCGGLSRWAAGKPIVSVPTLFNIAAMMVLVSMELDFLQAFTATLQALGAVLIFFVLYGWLVVRDERAAARAAGRP